MRVRLGGMIFTAEVTLRTCCTWALAVTLWRLNFYSWFSLLLSWTNVVKELGRNAGERTHLLLASLTRIAGVSSPLSLVGIDPWASHPKVCGGWDDGGRRGCRRANKRLGLNMMATSETK